MISGQKETAEFAAADKGARPTRPTRHRCCRSSHSSVAALRPDVVIHLECASISRSGSHQGTLGDIRELAQGARNRRRADRPNGFVDSRPGGSRGLQRLDIAPQPTCIATGERSAGDLGRQRLRTAPRSLISSAGRGGFQNNGPVGSKSGARAASRWATLTRMFSSP